MAHLDFLAVRLSGEPAVGLSEGGDKRDGVSQPDSALSSRVHSAMLRLCATGCGSVRPLAIARACVRRRELRGRCRCAGSCARRESAHLQQLALDRGLLGGDLMPDRVHPGRRGGRFSALLRLWDGKRKQRALLGSAAHLDAGAELAGAALGFDSSQVKFGCARLFAGAWRIRSMAAERSRCVLRARAASSPPAARRPAAAATFGRGRPWPKSLVTRSSSLNVANAERLTARPGADLGRPGLAFPVSASLAASSPCPRMPGRGGEATGSAAHAGGPPSGEVGPRGR